MSYVPPYGPAPPSYGGNSTSISLSTPSPSSTVSSTSISYTYESASTLTSSTSSSSSFTASSSSISSSSGSSTSVTVASVSTLTLSSSTSTSTSHTTTSTSSSPASSSTSSTSSISIPTISTITTSASSSASYTPPTSSSSQGASSSSASSTSIFLTSSTPISTATSAPYACPSCFFAATSATLYSFPATIVETVTAVYIPYKSICADGEISTWTSVAYTPATPTGGALLFSEVGEMTWETLGVEMTYPTTYAHFLGFERQTFHPSPTTIGASPPVGHASPTACPKGSTFKTPVFIPATATGLSAASLIAPVTGKVATKTVKGSLLFSVPIPTTMISYLQELGRRNEIPGLRDLESFGAIESFVENTTKVSSSASTSSSSSSATYTPSSATSSAPTTLCSTFTTLTPSIQTTLYTTYTSTCSDGDVVTRTTPNGIAGNVAPITVTACEVLEKRQAATTFAPLGLVPGGEVMWPATWLETSTASTRTVVRGRVVGGGAEETGI